MRADWALGADVLTAMAPLPEGYLRLTERIARWAGADDRVRGCWISGSIGRGEADAGSDLDIVLAVADDEVAEFRSGWRGWLAAWTPTIIADEVPGAAGIFFSVTPACERLDVVVESVTELSTTPHRARLRLLDKDDLGALVPVSPPGAGPDVQRLAAIVAEFHRQQALFPDAVVAREDWLLGVVGVGQAQILLYQLFVETNQPLPAMGVKQWSRRLTPEQRTVLAALPGPSADRSSVLIAMAAARSAMCTAGRAAAENAGLAWPVQVADAVAAHIDPVLSAPD